MLLCFIDPSKMIKIERCNDLNAVYQAINIFYRLKWVVSFNSPNPLTHPLSSNRGIDTSYGNTGNRRNQMENADSKQNNYQYITLFFWQ